MAEIVCSECGYRVNIIRTGPNSALPEHNLSEFERLCREGVCDARRHRMRLSRCGVHDRLAQA